MAGIDVFSKEPATEHPLLNLDNVTVTPHLGANTKESQRNIATQSAESAILAVKGISYPNALNLPIVESELPEFVAPFLELTQEGLGLFLGGPGLNKRKVGIKFPFKGFGQKGWIIRRNHFGFSLGNHLARVGSLN